MFSDLAAKLSRPRNVRKLKRACSSDLKVRKVRVMLQVTGPKLLQGIVC